MHRVDIARATGHTMVLTAEHDGRLVADLVVEWAITHGEPFTIDLDGIAGGTYVSGTGGEHVHIDAVEFCRVLSGARDRHRRACPPVTPLTRLPRFGYRGGRPLSLVTRRFASRFGRPTTVPALMTLSSETSDFALEMDSNHSRRLSRQTPTTTP